MSEQRNKYTCGDCVHFCPNGSKCCKMAPGNPIFADTHICPIFQPLEALSESDKAILANNTVGRLNLVWAEAKEMAAAAEAAVKEIENNGWTKDAEEKYNSAYSNARSAIHIFGILESPLSIYQKLHGR